MPLKYFAKAFGLNGDKTVVPDNTQVDGSVSYDSGYGFDYERDSTPGVDPLAKDIERDKMNQILFDVTSNVKQFQDFGAPEWSDTRAAAGYPRDARVTFGGVVYTSVADGNHSTPPASPWIIGGETDPTIIAIAALTPQANQFIYFTAEDAAAVAAITSFGRNFVAAADGAAGRALLGIVTANSITAGIQRQATDAEVNAGSDVVATPNPRQLRMGFSLNLSETAGHFFFPSWLGGWGMNWGLLLITKDSYADPVLSNPFTTTNVFRICGLGASTSDFFDQQDCPYVIKNGATGIRVVNPDTNQSSWISYLVFGR